MTARDRTVLLVVGIVLAVVAAWFLLLAPKRTDAQALDTKIAAAQARVTAAQAAEAAGAAAQAGYQADYAAVSQLGEAVPADDDTPSLLLQLQGAADRAHVDFRSIDLSTSGSSAAPLASNATAIQAAAGTTGASGATGAATSTPIAATQSAAALAPPGSVVGSAGLPTLPFDFTFNGSFFRLQDLLHNLDAFTTLDGSEIRVKGRLLSVDGFSLQASPNGFPQMQTSIHATAYVLPAAQGLTGGATAAAPAAGTTPTANPTGTTTP